MTSYDHLQVYRSIVREYLRKKGIADFKKFQMAISHDRPIFLKWEYAGIEKPTEEMLAKEFKIDTVAVRKMMMLDMKFIYIHAKDLANRIAKDSSLTAEQVLAKMNEPIYFNIDGDIIDPGALDVNDTVAISKNIIETMLKIDIETTPNYWVNEDKVLRERISIDNGMLKFNNQPVKLTTDFTGTIRVLVTYPKKIPSHQASEVEKVIRPAAAVHRLINSDTVNEFNKIII
jgi:hypothetical protein